jgi:CIC family chloride channel protein
MTQNESLGPPPSPQPRAPTGLPAVLERAGDRFLRWALRLGLDEQAVLLTAAAGIGLAAGGATLVFYGLLDGVSALVTWVEGAVAIPRVVVAALTLGGGLAIVRLLVRHLADDSPGENVPDLMRAVARHGGRLRLRRVLVKTTAAAVTIATGGAVGTEGPAAVLGGGLGSALGQGLRFRTNRLKLLVGCGAAAGISGAFGAPIAGVFFALEKILGNLRASLLAAVAVASVMAAAVTRSVLGGDQVIRIPRLYELSRNRELAAYALVGLLCGAVGVLYNRGTWILSDLLARLPRWLRLGLGALLVAGFGAAFPPRLWGHGHISLDLGAIAQTPAPLLAALALARIAATGLTLGAGGVGGVFMPAILIGGSAGGAAGALVRDLFPDAGVAVGPFALVGIGAAVAGATHAPLTAMFIVLELSGDYGLILPVMLATALGYAMARWLHRESIYSEWLVRRGERLSHGADQSVLEMHLVREVCRRRPIVARADDRLGEALPRLLASDQPEFPVVDASEHVVGLLTWADIKQVLSNRERDEAITMRAVARPCTETVAPNDTLLRALRRLGARDAYLLPVVDPAQGNRLVGVIGRQEIFAVYDRETA